MRSSTEVTNDMARAVEAFGEELADHQTSTNGNAAVFSVEVEGAPQDLHPILRDEIYRIATEALRNAFHHARAQRIEVKSGMARGTCASGFGMTGLESILACWGRRAGRDTLACGVCASGPSISVGNWRSGASAALGRSSF
jgi:glucose-6-phosphate-specific signal transduction histidine kinase